MTKLTLALALCGPAMLVTPTRDDGIDDGQFDELHRLITPGKAESAWERLPWLTDLWEARKLAAEQGKPVLLWERDGNPLGCV